MILSELKRTLTTNKDVDNTEPTAKQDCSDVVHLSIYFDGTGNNRDADNKKKKWSNPARLWRTADQFIQDAKKDKTLPPNYAIYVSGVGTRFNGELNLFQRAIAMMQDHGGLGMGAGLGGSRRLDYGNMQINQSLSDALIQQANKAGDELKNYANTRKNTTFAKISTDLSKHRLIKKINVSIFGFSRGAALARAFCNQWIWDCTPDCNGLKYNNVPIHFNFVGLFDTVASFGLPATNLNNKLPFMQRDLVIDERVGQCVHYVAGNELRFAFPVDLIHLNGKLTRSQWKEVVYPGMHSDVGGGYEPGSQNVDDNYARIPLKDMLTEAVQAGVRMYSYEELREKHVKIFQQFEIKPQTQQLYNTVYAMLPQNMPIHEQIQASMKMYYSAYGTMHRRGVQSVSQQARESSTIRKLIPIGPSDMATEMERLEAATQRSQTVSKPLGGHAVFKLLTPVSAAYEAYMSVAPWQFDSWRAQANDDVVKFYNNYVHDSKYGFLSNAEPFSYFRQRGIYESLRSTQGQISEQKQAQIQAQCSVVAAEAP